MDTYESLDLGMTSTQAVIDLTTNFNYSFFSLGLFNKWGTSGGWNMLCVAVSGPLYFQCHLAEISAEAAQFQICLWLYIKTLDCQQNKLWTCKLTWKNKSSKGTWIKQIYREKRKATCRLLRTAVLWYLEFMLNKILYWWQKKKKNCAYF